MSRTESDDRTTMRNPDPNPESTHGSEPFVLGRERFAQISAVEGIALTDEMKAMFEQFDRQGISAGERRRAIHQIFSKPPFPEVNLAEAIRRRFATLGGFELEIPPREPAREPPEFE